MTIAICTDMNVVDVMHYELRVYPVSLFGTQNLTKKPNKSHLAESIVEWTTFFNN